MKRDYLTICIAYAALLIACFALAMSVLIAQRNRQHIDELWLEFDAHRTHAIVTTDGAKVEVKQRNPVK